jgi:hypothetical protein
MLTDFGSLQFSEHDAITNIVANQVVPAVHDAVFLASSRLAAEIYDDPGRIEQSLAGSLIVCALVEFLYLCNLPIDEHYHLLVHPSQLNPSDALDWLKRQHTPEESREDAERELRLRGIDPEKLNAAIDRDELRRKIQDEAWAAYEANEAASVHQLDKPADQPTEPPAAPSAPAQTDAPQTGEAE